MVAFGLMVIYCEAEHLFNIASAAFTPKPKVVSALVRLNLALSRH